ncbi:MAG: CheR family methyltransferase [Longimicrobiales bacterium]
MTEGPLFALAHGELSERDIAELRALKQQIQHRTGFCCDGYKEKCLRRRIAVRMRARGVHAFGAYGDLLDTDPTEYGRLLEAVTINVSKFFRNSEVWARLKAEVVPRLFELDSPEIRVWSAGCAAGEEAYTLAMVVREHAERYGADASRFRITGTDVDVVTLENARKAIYGDFAFGETSPEQRERWFEGPQRNRVREDVRRMVQFRTMDLITDAYPRAQHLILCRNVVIYFERAVQEDVFRRFHQSLTPGGYLLLGKVEALFGGVTPLFRAISNRERLFRKP